MQPRTIYDGNTERDNHFDAMRDRTGTTQRLCAVVLLRKETEC